MAAAKITDLTALTTIATGDLFVVVDISDTTMGVNGTNKKITWGELMGAPGPIGGTTSAAGTFSTLTIGTTAILLNEAANTLALRNGTNAQIFLAYRSFTDADNYSRSYFRTNGTSLLIGTEGLGSGANTLDRVDIQALDYLMFTFGNVRKFYFSPTLWSFDVDNTFDIGAPGAAPKSGYFGTSLILGGDAILLRDAANTLALRNGTNAQSLKIYQSYTDASNYSRLNWTADASNYYFSSEKAGTGTFKQFVFSGLGTSFELSGIGSVWKIDATTPGSLTSQIAGSTVKIKSGSNAKAGTFTLSGGAATVSNTSVTANSVVQFTIKTSSGTPDGTTHVSATSVGTSFTVAGNAGDNSTYNYVILEVN